MNALKINDILSTHFLKEFPGVGFDYEYLTMEKGHMHAFLITVDKESTLSESWRRITNDVALHIQNQISDKFEKWNFYVFFILSHTISSDLKYKIENDTFSSRKIVIESIMSNAGIIQAHILNDNLKDDINQEQHKDTKLQFNQFLLDKLTGITLRKERITQEASIVLDKILMDIKSGVKYET